MEIVQCNRKNRKSIMNSDKSTRNAKNLNKLIGKYLETNALKCDSKKFTISNSNYDGFGVFAKCNIRAGDLIFRDHPIIIGPRSIIDEGICATCYCKTNLLQFCAENCGLKLCSKCNLFSHKGICELIQKWNKNNTKLIDESNSIKVLKALAPMQSLLISKADQELIQNLKSHKGPQHGLEINALKTDLKLTIDANEEEFMQLVCTVLDANAFEVPGANSSLRGLYPLASLANHSCTPNTYHVFDENQNMVVRATTDIAKGSELFHSYSRLIWGTTMRQYHLFKTKHFICKCERCMDPTEFGTFMDAVLCKNCQTGRIMQQKMQCFDCGAKVAPQDVAGLLSLLGAMLGSFEDGDLDLMLKFLDNKMFALVPQFNQVAVELKYKVVWLIGYSKGYTWTEAELNYLEVKRRFCLDLLELLKKLKLGQCRIKGLLLFELYRTLKEMQSRSTTVNGCVNENDVEAALEEAADILMGDVSAPSEVQEQWKKTNKILM